MRITCNITDESCQYNIKWKIISKTLYTASMCLYSWKLYKTKINVWICVCKYTQILLGGIYIKAKTILNWKQEKMDIEYKRWRLA